MDISSLVYIIEVAAEKSISKAAKKMFISQSNLSRIIQDMESNLGIKIFSRTNKGVELTKAGEEFIKQSESIIQDARCLQRIGRKFEYENNLRLSTTRSSFCVDNFMNMYNKYDENVNIDFMIRETKGNLVVRDIYYLYSDLGIISLDKIDKKKILNYLKQDNIIYEYITDLKPYAIMRNNHNLSNKEMLKLEELYMYGNIRYNTEDHVFGKYISKENPYDNLLELKKFKKIVEVTDRGTLHTILKNTDLIWITSEVENYNLDKYDLKKVEIEVDNKKNDRELGAIYLSEVGLTNIGYEFLHLLKEKYK